MNRRLFFVILFSLTAILTLYRRPVQTVPVPDSRSGDYSQFEIEKSTSSLPVSKLDRALRDRISHATELEGINDLQVVVVLSVPDEFANLLHSFFPDDTENHTWTHHREVRESLQSTRLSATEKQKELISSQVDQFLSRYPTFRTRLKHRLGLAPMFSLSASPREILRMARDPDVRFVGLDCTAIQKSGERTAAQAGFSAVWETDGYDGSGVNVGMVEEDDIPLPALTGPGQLLPAPLGIFDPDSTTNHAHATDVAGVIWSRDSMFRGLASGSNPYFATASTDSGRAAAVDWCIQQGCSIVNLSWGTPAGQNTGDLKWIDLYHDWVTEINRVLIVAAAGNDGLSAGRVISPGNGFNVLTVGMVNGNDPNTWADDEIADSSNHVDPVTGAMKPELVSYGVNIKSLSANPPFSAVTSGTSFSTPVVTSAAALCVQANPDSADEPMTLKAQLMASGVAHDFPGTERDGGGVAMAQAYRAATSSRAIYRDNNDNLEWTISLKGGEKNRIVLCYPHRPVGTVSPDSTTPVDNGNSYHRIDLDFEVFVDGARVGFSGNGVDQTFELLDYTPPADTAAVVKIAKWDWPSADPRAELRIGLAHATSSDFGNGPDSSNDDAFEPNDSEVESASLSLHESHSELKLTDEDWYSLIIPANSTTTAQIHFPHDAGDLELLAKRSDGTAEIRSESADNFETVQITTGSSMENWKLAVYAYFSEQNRAPYDLTIRSDLPPRASTITTPVDDTLTTTTPTLTCTVPGNSPNDVNPANIIEAEWEISEDSHFASTVFRVRGGDTGTLGIPEQTLYGERRYYCRVRHFDTEGKPSPWSQPVSFHTRTTPTFPASHPPSGSINWSSQSATISWDAVSFAESYEVRSANGNQLIGTSATPDLSLPASSLRGLLSFQVTALNGPAESEPFPVTITLPPRKVDGQIGLRRNRLLGNNRYNRSGRKQTLKLPLLRRRWTRFFFSGQNDSSGPDIMSFRLKKRRHFKLRVSTLSRPRRNVSGKITRNRYESPVIFPGKRILFQVRIQSKSGRRRKFRVKQRSLFSSLSASGVRQDVTALKTGRR
ncbi:MAG: S8 family serine peptidase [Verrucomicrobiales bacterium]|nr:S8 family serine peptidase [Verrucomicrobiales bacterium]